MTRDGEEHEIIVHAEQRSFELPSMSIQVEYDAHEFIGSWEGICQFMVRLPGIYRSILITIKHCNIEVMSKQRYQRMDLLRDDQFQLWRKMILPNGQALYISARAYESTD